jgi:RsiW-degrading membrane proteinase PrsW (M82 family)
MKNARLHFLTRDPATLLRGSALLCGIGFGLAWLITLMGWQLQPAGQRHPQITPQNPEQLALLISQRLPEDEASLRKKIASQSFGDFLDDLGAQSIGAEELQAQIQRLVPDPRSAEVFRVFLKHCDAPSADTLATMEKAASVSPVPPFANLLLALALENQQEDTQAMLHYLAEASQPTAALATSRAAQLALELEDAESLARLRQLQPAHFSTLTGWDRCAVGVLLRDPMLQAKGAVSSVMENAHWSSVLLSAMVVGIWFFILLRYRDHTDSLPWWWGFAPMAAGVLSIALTVWAAQFQELRLGLKEGTTGMQMLLYDVLGVGLREELSKLIMVLPFLPWLLKRKSPGLALLTGGFVGLGFAFEENIGYMTSDAATVGITRLITANFLHVAMTGTCALALFDLFGRRHSRYTDFMVTLGTIIALHGVYDWSSFGAPEISFLGSVDIFGIVLLALLAQHFFRSISDTLRPQRAAFSAMALMVWGTSILVALAFVSSALLGMGTGVIAMVGFQVLGVVPLIVMHTRHLSGL